MSAILRQTLGTLAAIPGVRAATLSLSSLISANTQLPIIVNDAPPAITRILQTGPEFFTTMQISLRLGRPIDDRDQRSQGAAAVVVSDLFAREHFSDENPIGRHIKLGGAAPQDLEIVGVVDSVRYGGLKREIPPVVYIPYARLEFPPLRQMTFAFARSRLTAGPSTRTASNCLPGSRLPTRSWRSTE